MSNNKPNKKESSGCDITDVINNCPKGDGEFYLSTSGMYYRLSNERFYEWFQGEFNIQSERPEFYTNWCLKHLKKVPTPWYDYELREAIGVPPIGCVAVERGRPCGVVIGHASGKSAAMEYAEGVISITPFSRLKPLDWDKLPQMRTFDKASELARALNAWEVACNQQPTDGGMLADVIEQWESNPQMKFEVVK